MEQVGRKTGVIYCRVSSKDQVENTSLESQERNCREYAERQQIDVVKVFIEKGESAKTIDRTEFTKAIDFCSNKKHRVGFFIVYKIDRFARNQYDHATMRAILKRSGTELRSVTEPISETSAGKAMEGMISVFAEFDNNVRTERTKGGMVERIKQGVWVWQAPVGYYHRPHKGSNIAPKPNTAHYIRLLFEEWVKKTHSYESLATFLFERGFRTKNGKKPFPQLIEKIIRNPLYCGIIDAWDMRITGNFEAIISEELFERCQRGKINKSRFEKRNVSNPDFPLRRSICLTCLNPITGSYSKGRSGTRYAYYHHHRQNCVEAKFIPKATFEQLFVEYLNEITPSIRYENTFKAVMTDIWKSNYKKFDEQNGKIRKEVEKLEQERQRVFDLHRFGTYSDEEFSEQKSLVNQQIMEKSQLLHDNRIEEFNMEEALNHCFQFVRNTSVTWLRLKYENKIRFQNNIFPKKVGFNGKRFGTKKLASIYAMNQEYAGKKSNLVAPGGIGPPFTP